MSNLSELEDILKIRFKDKDLLLTAVTHRSFLNESTAPESNERLEFLGDSILGLLTSVFLYQRFPKAPEGELTAIRSLLVRTTTLAEVAREINLGDYLRMSRGERQSGGAENDALLADGTEALIGAIFLDQGPQSVEGFLRTYLFPKVSEIEKSGSIADFKNQLQESIQEKYKELPVYKVIKTSGPEHKRIFIVGVWVKGALLGQGEGSSKREAQQNAAKEALKKAL